MQSFDFSVKKLSILLAAIASFIFLSACSSEGARKVILTPAKVLLPDEYQRTIIQGRKLEKEKVDLIMVGSSQNDVILFLGQPVIRDVFNPDKWIYLYKEQTEDKGLIEYRVEIVFDDNTVKSIIREGI